MEKAPLCKMLEKYAQTTELRLHMPAHGGRFVPAEAGSLAGAYRVDLTELPDTDDLYNATGAILESERIAADMFGSGETLFSCGGATLALQGAISTALSCAKNGKKVGVMRNCHKSVINALGLIDAEIEFFCDIPSANEMSGLGVFIYTSCDYYGRIADSGKIAELCHAFKTVAIADNSHGSHLAFLSNSHPLSSKIDFVVDSFHKTLPVLTGGAALHISKQICADFSDIRRTANEYMALFGSSSPSFLILSSIDAALDELRNHPETLSESAAVIAKLKKRLGALAIDNNDPLRIVLAPASPEKLYKALYERGIKGEFYDREYVVIIPPYGFGTEDAEQLFGAIKEISPKAGKTVHEKKAILPQRKISIHMALFEDKEEISLKRAKGRVSGAQYAVYPPGIPQITAGEVFDENVIEALTGSVEKVRVLAVKSEE